MRMKWRGLELPGRVIPDESVRTESFGRFVIEPFEQGFGTTIGNSLRRVLLSSLEGAAITTVKIEGVSHEFTTIDGVLEDVADIILNIKGVVVRYKGDEAKSLRVERTTAGEVRAGDLVCDPAVTIVNPDHVIATLTAAVPFRAQFMVGVGRGYATAADNRKADQELGIIPVDSIYSPVVRVRYRTEDMRVGQRTNYDRLIMEIWTNGTIRPEDALVEAGLILRKHLNPFVLYSDLGTQTVAPLATIGAEQEPSGRSALEELLDKSISVLSLSVRATNCLEGARISTLRDLVALTEADLLRFRSFGKTSLHEVQTRLSEVGLRLGMKVHEGGEEAGDFDASLAEGPHGDAPTQRGLHHTPLGEYGGASVSSPASGSMYPGGEANEEGEAHSAEGEPPSERSSSGKNGPPSPGPMAAYYTMED